MILQVNIPVQYMTNRYFVAQDGVFPTGVLAGVDEARLLLVYETSLFSNIQAMSIVRLAGSATDLLIMSFADAKVSVVTWESEKHELGIVSLHYFEKEAGATVRRMSYLFDSATLERRITDCWL